MGHPRRRAAVDVGQRPVERQREQQVLEPHQSGLEVLAPGSRGPLAAVSDQGRTSSPRPSYRGRPPPLAALGTRSRSAAQPGASPPEEPGDGSTARATNGIDVVEVDVDVGVELDELATGGLRDPAGGVGTAVVVTPAVDDQQRGGRQPWAHPAASKVSSAWIDRRVTRFSQCGAADRSVP
jgi:hypothetical protein